jgi:sialic acid synthase SpsE
MLINGRLDCIDTGKDIILSTDRPMDKWLPLKQIKQVYCIPKYPTEYGELNFDMIKLLPGYSNHCLNPLACLKAVRYGAQYLEYHLTDDRYAFAIDNKVSLSYAEMAEVNWWIRRFVEYKKLKFEIECDEITDRQRESIHIFIRKTLDRNNRHLVMKGLWPTNQE